jgi:hypothetical protein
MILARPFKAGKNQQSVLVAQRRLKLELDATSLRDENLNDRIPALKRRAKFRPTLRAEDTR